MHKIGHGEFLHIAYVPTRVVCANGTRSWHGNCLTAAVEIGTENASEPRLTRALWAHHGIVVVSGRDHPAPPSIEVGVFLVMHLSIAVCRLPRSSSIPLHSSSSWLSDVRSGTHHPPLCLGFRKYHHRGVTHARDCKRRVNDISLRTVFQRPHAPHRTSYRYSRYASLPVTVIKKG